MGRHTNPVSSLLKYVLCGGPYREEAGAEERPLGEDLQGERLGRASAHVLNLHSTEILIKGHF